jgi:predicted DNA binding CopG/RHH family protein
MERENIERLTIDAAAGELNQDAETLFGAYLAEHPEASRWARNMLQTYEKTQAAIHTKTANADVSSGRPVIKKKGLPYLRWQSLIRWAAVLLVGIVIGHVAPRRPAADRTGPTVLGEPHQRQAHVKTVQDLKQKYAGTFWGDKILALMEHRPRQFYRGTTSDTSLWDRYRQYVKEKHHE